MTHVSKSDNDRVDSSRNSEVSLALKVAVYGMGALLVVGFFTLMGVIVARALSGGPKEQAAVSVPDVTTSLAASARPIGQIGSQELKLPQGAEIQDIFVDDGLIAVHLTVAGAHSVRFYNLQSKELIGDVVIVVPPAGSDRSENP